MRLKHLLSYFMVALCLVMASPSFAADGVSPLNQDWKHKGFLGTFDRAALQRGFQVYKQVCSACHSLELMSYRNLSMLGYSDEEIRAIAAEDMVVDGPNDEGEMFERPATPADRFKSPYPNNKAARYANNGALPPDLSLIVRARHYGEDYIYSLLVGYEEAPADFNLMPGMSYNAYFPGHQIAMAAPLVDDVVSFEDGTAATVEQTAHDVATFLAWTSDPHQEARKKMGVKVILFLIVLFGLFYMSKKQVWRDIKKK